MENKRTIELEFNDEEYKSFLTMVGGFILMNKTLKDVTKSYKSALNIMAAKGIEQATDEEMELIKAYQEAAIETEFEAVEAKAAMEKEMKPFINRVNQKLND